MGGMPDARCFAVSGRLDIIITHMPSIFASSQLAEAGWAASLFDAPLLLFLSAGGMGGFGNCYTRASMACF